MRNFNDFLNEQLQDPKFRCIWESNEPAAQIARQIVGYRIKHGLSQRQLAAKVGMAQPAIARIESFDYGRVTISTLQKLAQALDLDLKIELLEKAS